MKIYLLSFILLTGCTSGFIYPTIDREGEKIIVTVNSYRNSADLNESAIQPSHGLKGQALYYLDSNDCEIKIQKPISVRINGDYTMTMGHELMHCIYGDYH